MTDSFKEYLYYASEIAMGEYRKTKESKQLSEQAMKVCEELEGMFTVKFLDERLGALLEPESARGDYLYLRGHLDCVGLLKELGVI